MSKKIKVYKIKSNYEEVLDVYNKNNKRPNGSPIHEASVLQIGASLKALGLGKINLGESFENVKLIFQSMVGGDITLDKIEQYYIRTRVDIPPLGLKGEGYLELEIGFVTDAVGKFEKYKEGKEEKVNLPINPFEYVQYLILKTSPLVAMSKEDINSHHAAYILDEETINNEQEEIMNLKLKANTELLKLQDSLGKFNKEELKKYLYLLKGAGVDFGKPIHKMKTSEYAVNLSSIVDSNPKLFLQVVNDKEQDVKYTIELMIAYSILTVSKNGKISNGYDELGTMNETIKWFKDKVNQNEVGVLEQKLEDAQKAKLV